MARMKVKLSRSALRRLMQTDLVSERAAAIAEACNEESSWGGYASAKVPDPTRAQANVWTYASQDGNGDTDRANRMIRNLDAGG